MILEHFAVGDLACTCTIVGDPITREALIIDGGDEPEKILAKLATHNLRAKYLLHTHAHIDHIGAVGALREHTRAQAFLHPGDLPLYQGLDWQAQMLGYADIPPVVPLDGDLADEMVISLGDIKLIVHHTPGHTPGSSSFALDGGDTIRLLTGDTLFAGSIGRWDLGGTSQADIVRSIKEKLLAYSDTTVVIPGHGPFTTIGEERRSNPFL